MQLYQRQDGDNPKYETQFLPPAGDDWPPVHEAMGRKRKEHICRGYKALWDYLRGVAQQLHRAEDPQPPVEQGAGHQRDASRRRSAACASGGSTPSLPPLDSASLEQLLALGRHLATGQRHAPEPGASHHSDSPPAPAQTRAPAAAPPPPGSVWKQPALPDATGASPAARGAPASRAMQHARAPRSTREPPPAIDAAPLPMLPPPMASPRRSTDAQVPQEPQVHAAAPAARPAGLPPSPPSDGGVAPILPPDFHSSPSRPTTLVPRQAPDASRGVELPDAHSRDSPMLQRLSVTTWTRCNQPALDAGEHRCSKRPLLQTSATPRGASMSPPSATPHGGSQSHSTRSGTAGRAPPSQAHAAHACGTLASQPDTCTCQLRVSMNGVYSCCAPVQYCCVAFVGKFLGAELELSSTVHPQCSTPYA